MRGFDADELSLWRFATFVTVSSWSKKTSPARRPTFSTLRSSYLMLARITQCPPRFFLNLGINQWDPIRLSGKISFSHFSFFPSVHFFGEARVRHKFILRFYLVNLTKKKKKKRSINGGIDITKKIIRLLSLRKLRRCLIFAFSFPTLVAFPLPREGKLRFCLIL